MLTPNAAPPCQARSLSELAANPDGRAFLRERGIFFDVREFLGRLEAPETSVLAEMFGADPRSKPVYTVQQIYADYRWSVVGKLLTLNGLRETAGLLPCALWLDTDRCGSDEPSTRFLWPVGKRHSARLVANRAREQDAETRFASVDRARLRDVADWLERSLASLAAPDRRRRRRAQDRFRPIRDILLDESLTTLRDVNGALTGHLFEAHLGLRPRWRYVSELLELDAVKRAIELTVNNLDAFTTAYNDAVRDLLERGVDPQVRPRARDELPLFYSTPPPDGRRLRLRHEVDDTGGHYATARTDSGEIHRFHLGTRHLSIDALASSRRWSPDVSLPLFLNGLVSGVVAGRSSALYGLVLNGVWERLFGTRGAPVLVPDPALDPADYGFERDSLFYSYLFADVRAAG